MTTSSERSTKQTLALIVALITLVLLIINVASVGLDNFSEVIRMVLFVLIFVLAIWWLRTRDTGRWIGWVVGLIFAVLLVLNLVNFGLNNFVEVLTVVLLAILFVVSAGWAMGKDRSSA